MSLEKRVAEHVALGAAEVGRRLGRVKMPEGYALMLDHDELFFYWLRSDGTESFEHHDKWAIYRGARAQARYASPSSRRGT